jgi:hypothetical protein
MNEFIVWDKDIEKFEYLNNTWLEFGLEVEPMLVNSGAVGYERISTTNISIHNYIGKTDIEGNKIYANSSIVEVNDSKSKFYEDICIVRYDKNICSFMLCSVDFEDDRQEHFRPDYSNKNYKVIGTLQENPELLK